MKEYHIAEEVWGYCKRGLLTKSYSLRGAKLRATRFSIYSGSVLIVRDTDMNVLSRKTGGVWQDTMVR